jgi:hypothetical protein
MTCKGCISKADREASSESETLGIDDRDGTSSGSQRVRRTIHPSNCRKNYNEMNDISYESQPQPIIHPTF